MPAEQQSEGKGILDPVERTSEVLFGLIMVLSFTGSLSVASAGREEVRTVLIGAIGCNLAWGLVDAVMYVLTNLTVRGRQADLLRRIRKQKHGTESNKLLSELLPPEIAGVVDEAVLGQIANGIRQMPEPATRRLISANDLVGALGVFLLVFLSTFPVVLPFVFSDELLQAMRWSNGVALVMMFLCGLSLGKYGGFPAMRTGLTMIGLGVLLVGLTISLGG
jgi:hypothetical protein